MNEMTIISMYGHSLAYSVAHGYLRCPWGTKYASECPNGLINHISNTKSQKFSRLSVRDLTERPNEVRLAIRMLTGIRTDK